MMNVVQLYFGFLLQYYLLLAVAQENQVERRYACWGSVGPPVVSAQCPRNTIIQVTRAGLKVQNNAGSKCEFDDKDCGCTTDEPGCQMPDVDHLCMGKSACRLDVTQQYIDTGGCQGFSDYMFIEYKCVQAADEASRDICMTSTFQQSSGFIKSPNYPSTYPDNQLCECSLISMADATINIDILALQLADNDCQNDEVVLEYNTQLTKLCGQSNGLRDRIITRSQDVKVRFQSDTSQSGTGFWMKYEAKPKSPIQVKCTTLYQHEENIVYDAPEPVNKDIELVMEPEVQIMDEVTLHERGIQLTTTEALLAMTISDDYNRIEQNRQDFEDIIFEEENNSNLGNETPQELFENSMESLAKELKYNMSNVNSDNTEQNQQQKVEDTEGKIDESSNVQRLPKVVIVDDIPVEFTDDGASVIYTQQQGLDTDSKDSSDPNSTNRINTDINIRESDIRNEVIHINSAQEQTLPEGNTVIVVSEGANPRSQQNKPNYIQRQPRPIRRNQIHFDQDGQRTLHVNDERETVLHVDKDDLLNRGNENQGDENTLRPYDRISFEREMFEEYTNKIDQLEDAERGNQNRETQPRPRNTRPNNIRPNQRHLQRPHIRPRQRVNNRPRLEQTTANEERPRSEQRQRPRPEQTVPRQRFDHRTRSQERLIPQQRMRTEQRSRNRPEQRTRSDLPPRIHSSQRINQRKPQVNIRTSNNLRNNINHEQPPKTNAPWWWQFTANSNIKPSTTRPPTRGSILNDKMKSRINENNSLKEKPLVDSKMPVHKIDQSKSNILNAEVPPDNSADNIMVSENDRIQTGLLGGEEQEDTETEHKKDSITVTATAVGIIALIVLIVAVGVIIKWALNKREQKRVLRHRHKKECAMRQQHLRQSSSTKPKDHR